MEINPIPNLTHGLVPHRRKKRPGLPKSKFSASLGLASILGLLAWSVVVIPFAGLAGSGVTISTHGSISPNGRSPSWSNWWDHAVAAVQSGVTSTGDQATDPTAWVERTTYRYIEVIETRDPDARIDLGFNSWLGFADPSGAAAQESGGMLNGVARILGNGTKIKLSNLHWSWNDDGGAWSLTNSRAISNYPDIGGVGIDYGPDGKLSGGDDVIYASGSGATNLVDEIIFSPGPFYYAKTYDFQAPPAGLTNQQILNWADNFITTNDNYATSNTFLFNLFDDNGAVLTSASLHCSVIGQPTLYFAHTADQLVLRWPGLGFALESSPALGLTTSWTAVPAGTNSPVTITLSGGKAGFWRLRNQ